MINVTIEDGGNGAKPDLADFDRVVELLVRESENYNATRSRMMMMVMMSGGMLIGMFAMLSIYKYSGVIFSFVDYSLLTMSVIILVILPSYIFALKFMRDIRRQRRVVDELAELVRETVPVFASSMTLLRRAELRIRLSNIEIYDPLKYQ